MCPRAAVSLFIFTALSSPPTLSTSHSPLFFNNFLLLLSFQFSCGVSADQFPIVALIPHLVLHIPLSDPSDTLTFAPLHQAE